jgi:hypothetical protein
MFMVLVHSSVFRKLGPHGRGPLALFGVSTLSQCRCRRLLRCTGTPCDWRGFVEPVVGRDVPRDAQAHVGTPHLVRVLDEGGRSTRRGWAVASTTGIRGCHRSGPLRGRALAGRRCHREGRGRAAWGRPVLVPVHLVSQAIVVRGGDGALGRVRGVRRAVPEAVRIRVRETRGTVVLRAGLLFMLFMQ